LASLFLTTGDTNFIASTIIDGGGASRVLDIRNTNISMIVTGFTIRNGEDGIFPRSKFQLLNNRIIECVDGVDYESGSGGTCRYNVFENNTDDGIDLDQDVDIVIENNVIRNNLDDGIEIRLHPYVGPTLNYIIRWNTIYNNGEDGIQLIDYDTFTNRVFFIEHNLIYDNAMAGLGCMSGQNTIENYEGASIMEPIYLTNNIFDNNNHAITGGDSMIAMNNIVVNSTVLGMKNVDGNSLISYTDFWQNGTNVQNCNTDAGTIIYVDPLLNPDYTLQPGSPCIDAGSPDCTDPDGTICDIGVYYFNQSIGPLFPVPVFPLDDATNLATSLTLRWNRSLGATSYQLELATDINFVNIVLDHSSLTDTSDFVGSLSAVTTYHWRVSAENDEGTSAYSPLRSFTTVATAHSPYQVRTFETWPGGIILSTDPTGITYHPPSSHLFISDSEINEINSIWNNENVFEASLAGDQVFDTYDSRAPNGKREPTGITYSLFDGFFYVTDDDRGSIMRYDSTFGSPVATAYLPNDDSTATDPEGITSNPSTGYLYVADGKDGGKQVLVYDSMLQFVSKFSVANKMRDPKGIAYHSPSDHLFVISAEDSNVFKYTLEGIFVDEYNLSSFFPPLDSPQGLAFAPSSDPTDDPNNLNLYIVDKQIDNNADPNERDGIVYEADIPPDILEPSSSLTASVKVFLEGPFDTTTNLMNKNLNIGGILATEFPGASIPSEAVDVINIEMRDSVSAASSTIREFAAAWLLSNGSICSFSDTTKNYAQFVSISAGQYYHVVVHRNHLAVMSSSSQFLDSSTPPPVHDFTTSQSQAFGLNPMKAVGSSFAMISGDAGGDAGVGATDLVNVRNALGSDTYDVNDVNMNAGVGATDLIRMRENLGQASQVP
jgi:hypothetical protein